MATVNDVDGLTIKGPLTPSGGISVGSAAPVAGFSAGSVSAAVTAAGTNLATATALTSEINLVTTAASGTGVALPAATPIGGKVVVQNLGANDLEVFPPAADGVINGASAGTAITLATATKVVLTAHRVSATAWIATVAAGPVT